MLKKHKIIVNQINESKAILTFFKDSIKNIEAEAFIGENGFTIDKVEGDGKTPIGKFELGICFGTHEEKSIMKENYIKINENLYWVDDVQSKYYNQMVDIRKVKKDWASAEHLIEYPKQYEYAIEIKTNPKNIPGKGSAIFLHCSVGRATQGCIAIKKEKMEELFNLVGKEAIIIIKK